MNDSFYEDEKITTGNTSIDPDIQLNEDGDIEMYLECWFDVEKRFSIRLDNDTESIDVYAIMDSDSMDVRLAVLHRYEDFPSDTCFADPDPDEKEAIITLAKKKIRNIFGLSIQEFKKGILSA